MVTAVIKRHGAKSYLATKIRSIIPHHLTYCEPYFGGGSVLFTVDGEGVSEVVNDLDSQLMNFWYVLRENGLFEQFVRRAESTPFSQKVFETCLDHYNTVGRLHTTTWQSEKSREWEHNLVSAAWAFFVVARQSLAGRMKSFTPLSTSRLRRNQNEQVSAWLTSVEGLLEVHKRLRRVVLLSEDANDVIKRMDREQTFFYCDPPYLQTTRTAKNVYDHEMSEEDHKKLLETLCTIEGKFALSGYHSPLYDDIASTQGWTCTEFEIANSAAGGKTKRKMIECLYQNY